MSGSLGFSGGGVGSIADFPFDDVPGGWLECDGGAYSRSAYAALFSKIGTTFGSGDGSTTFNVPDCRDIYIKGKNVGVNAGTYTPDTVGNHGHPGSVVNCAIVPSSGAGSYPYAGPVANGSSRAAALIASYGSVTEPKTYAFLRCIKY